MNVKLFGYIDDVINMILGWPVWAKWFIFGLVAALIIWFIIEYRRNYGNR